MADPPALRVLNGTGELHDGLEDLTHDVLVGKVRSLTLSRDSLAADLIRAENDLRDKRAQMGGLKARITIQNRVDGLDDVIEGLLIYWRNTLRGPDSKVCVDVDSKRGESVRKRLKALIQADDDPGLANPDKDQRADAVEMAAERAAVRIRAAIDGCARAPFMGAYGKRYAEPGQGRTRKDDLHLHILKDEVSMERFEAIVESEPRRLAYRAELADRLKREPNLRLVLASLGPFVDGEILARCVRWCATQEALR
jgi:hypothetical protein